MAPALEPLTFHPPQTNFSVMRVFARCSVDFLRGRQKARRAYPLSVSTTGDKAMTSEAKQALWMKIQKEHRELAAALQAAKARGDKHIGIDDYPIQTVDWMWYALKRHKPELCEVIAQQLRPMADAFDGPGTVIEVAIEELVEALMMEQGDGGDKGCRRAAA